MALLEKERMKNACMESQVPREPPKCMLAELMAANEEVIIFWCQMALISLRIKLWVFWREGYAHWVKGPNVSLPLWEIFISVVCHGDNDNFVIESCYQENSCALDHWKEWNRPSEYYLYCIRLINLISLCKFIVEQIHFQKIFSHSGTNYLF